MNSITFVIMEDVNIDVIAAELGALLIDRFHIDVDNIRCVSLNETDIVEAIAKKSVAVNPKENIAKNSVYQALVFLNKKYGLNIRYSLDKFINDITNDLLTVLFKDQNKLLQDEKALINAVKIIGEADESEIKKYLHEAKVFQVYIAPIKRVYKLL